MAYVAPNIEKRRRLYYAVVEIPRPLREKFGRARFVQSLGTDCLKTAKYLAGPIVVARSTSRSVSARAGEAKPLPATRQANTTHAESFLLAPANVDDCTKPSEMCLCMGKASSTGRCFTGAAAGTVPGAYERPTRWSKPS